MSWAEEQDWFGSEDMILQAQQRYFELVEEGIWKTQKGEYLRIRDMDTNHIKNCIKCIYKSNGNWRPEYLRLFENELRRRKYSSEWKPKEILPEDDTLKLIYYFDNGKWKYDLGFYSSYHKIWYFRNNNTKIEPDYWREIPKCNIK
jgi:hypothetical protein